MGARRADRGARPGPDVARDSRREPFGSQWAIERIGTAIAKDDYVQVGDALYEVVGPARDAGGRGRHLELDLLLVAP